MPPTWEAVEVLADVRSARAAAATDLRAAAVELLDVADGVVVESRRDLVRAATGDGPVTVGDVRLDRDGVTARLAVAVPDAPARVVLRTLAASAAVGPSVETLEVTAEVDGVPVPARVEPDLDRVVVDLGEPRPDGVVLGLDLAYDLPRADQLVGGGPGGYGLLADHGDVVTLGHWLPAVVAIPGNDGEVPDWGDLGAFDAGTWLVDVAVDGGVLRTGGVDRLLPDGRQRALGFGLRDLAATWFPDGADPVTSSDPDAPVVLATSADGAGDRQLADLSGEQLAWYATTWGDLPWTEYDVVRAPILPAAGMEFPGLVIMDDSYWAVEEVPTRFALAHEWGHQYAHALVGNGSLSDPVVDEPLAQYLTWRWLRHADGPEFAEDVVRGAFDDDTGAPLEAPGMAAEEFSTAAAYGVAIYRTAAAAWHDAALDHGVEEVDAAVGAVLQAGALAELDEDAMLDEVDTVAPEVASDLRRAFDGR